MARYLFAATEVAVDSIRLSRIQRYQVDRNAPLNIKTLSGEDTIELENLRQTIYTLANSLPQRYLFLGTEADLKTLQVLIKSNIIDKNNQHELCGLGIIFGDTLSKRLDLHWATGIDDLGETPTLQYQDMGTIIYTRDIIRKLIERDEELDIHYLYTSFIELVREMIASKDIKTGIYM